VEKELRGVAKSAERLQATVHSAEEPSDPDEEDLVR
jgi:hypothetical protein